MQSSTSNCQLMAVARPNSLAALALQFLRYLPVRGSEYSKQHRFKGLPDTILGWYRKLVARKFDGSKVRRGPGRPRIKREVEELIIRMASENRDWGYDRIAGALANLGYEISEQTVGNVLRRHGVLPAPERKRSTTWAAFIRTHVALLAGTDFFTVEATIIERRYDAASAGSVFWPYGI